MLSIMTISALLKSNGNCRINAEPMWPSAPVTTIFIWDDFPKRQKFSVIVDVIIRFVKAVAKYDEHRTAPEKFHGIPKAWRHKQRPVDASHRVRQKSSTARSYCRRAG